MTNSDLRKLRNKLPKDGSLKIALKTGFTRAYVNMVLAGVKHNLEIIDCAIEVAENYQHELVEKSEKIKSL